MKSALILLLFFYASGVQQSCAQSKLDDYFDQLFNKQKFMGSVAICHNDSLIYSKSVGYADVQNKVSNNPETKFRIGSLTKTFTAALVLRAIEENKLKLSDLLASYYPQIKNASRITIEQLLNHRSGIFNFTEIEGEQEWEQQYHTEAEFITFFVKQNSNSEPGKEYNYSNTNYALLGFILQKIYHKTFAEILDEKICKPLLLKNTYYTFKVEVTKNEALSYNIQNKYIKNGNVNFSNHPASGGIVSTPTDLNRFLYSLFHGKIISKQSLDRMLPANQGEYGMGIEKLSVDNPVGFTHTGRVENYISDYWYFPKEDLGVVTLTNAVNISIFNINNILTRYAFGIKPEIPDFDQISGLSPEECDKIKGTYLDENKKHTVTISSNGQSLVFQHSKAGQIYVPFDYLGNKIFKYENITLSFSTEKKEMKLLQDGILETYIKIIN
ncbi:hypothetical protein AQ505_09620 [Pedobacter sp. PACM 27299]|uniref:serine hydrolase domain-containing protein n=1 Tax=Pedobacter sp. PACM 27299 TaxID=1727164 RepID=UPI0007058F4A|nr:serine hydrolase domain-containing protein [Pedobacter sp. PACM 27299]ALL05727.1 hypothetical protein AQ505_09620 [Pedobacter sp. PACM 27299]